MIIDILFILVLVLAIFRGLSRGLILGLVSFFAVLIGLAAALKLSVVVAGYLKNSVVAATRWLPLISFVLVLIVVLLLVELLGRLVKKAVQFAMLGWLDSLGGMILYVGLYTIIFSICLFYANKLLFLKPDDVAGSKVYSYIAPWGPRVMNNLGKVIPVFKNMFAELEDFFTALAKKAA